MALDGSFKKPGAIPFKWEIRPGVPKVQARQTGQQKQHQQQASDRSILENDAPKEKHENEAFPQTPRKLAPPPAGFNFRPETEPRTRPFLSAPRTRSEHYRFYTSTLAQPECVDPVGCLPLSPLTMSRKNGKKGRSTRRLKVEPESEPGCSPDLETLFRWSVSGRKSLSPFGDSSPFSSSFSSHRSSSRRRPNDAEWASFGLF